MRGPSLLLLLFLPCLVQCIDGADGDDLIVTTSYGKLKGYESFSKDGTRVKIFKGIPFAAPPVGALRWKVPVLPSPWTGIRDATKYSAACMSNSTVTSSPQENVSEDCLYLNIFMAGSCSPSSPCPIVVYMHGGGMNYDSAVYFEDGPLVETFASKGVLFVIPAYRLGFTGLLDLGDGGELIPKNLGVHDCLLALSFLEKEGLSLGGDTSRTSLFGHSFGGTLALVLAYSPMKSLPISRVVAMSPEVRFNTEANLRNLSRKFVAAAGCNSSTSREEYDCLMAADGHDLLAVQRRLEEALPPPPPPLHRHLSLQTETIQGNDDAPTFAGITLNSPVFPFTSYAEIFDNPQNIDLVIGSTMAEMDYGGPPKYAYGLGEVIGAKNIAELDEINYRMRIGKEFKVIHEPETQCIYVAVYLFAKSVSRKGKVFVYNFDQPTNNHHTNDLSYLMGVHPFEKDDNEKVIASFYPDLFVNFTRFGVPSPNWRVFDSMDSFYSIKVDTESGRMPEMRPFYQKETIDFWVKSAPKMDKIITVAKAAGGKLKWNTDTKEGLWRGLEIEDNEELDMAANRTVSAIVLFPSAHRHLLVVLFMVCLFVAGVLAGRFWFSSTEENETVLIVGPNGKPLRVPAENVPLLARQVI